MKISSYILALSGCWLMTACSEKIEITVDTEESATPEQTVDYNFHIRPILSDKCFFCHGPDIKNNKAGFRLNTAEAAYAALKDSKGYGIVPGDIHHSEVWNRINTKDPELLMPPKESKLVLTDEEKDLIKKWIEQGAEYKPHWAFLDLPKAITVPDLKDEWVKHPIDAFVMQEHQAKGLKHSKEAAPERWLRRVSFDLTGLPPTDKDVTQFLKAVSEDGEKAYEEVVDRLLASKSYGEHQAVNWLDAARYADSYGFQSDLVNVSWPYRDWVVRAFNDNLPYNTFITWQLAGDLLPEPTSETILATAYNRLHRLTNEGGAIREEFLVENALDRLHTYSTSMMALTMECSRCHDHKYDPISQKDYFQFSAFFNSIPEEGLYSHSSIIPTPSLLLPSDQQKASMLKIDGELKAASKKLSDLLDSEKPLAQKWITDNPEIEPSSLVADLIADYRFDEGKTIVNHAGKDSANAGAVELTEGKSGMALKFDGDRGVELKGVPTLDRHTPFSFSLWLKDTLHDPANAVIFQKTFGTDVGYNGIDLSITDGILIARLFRVWPGNGVGIRSVEPIPQDQWQHVVWSYDGSSLGEGMKFYLNGKQIKTEIIGTQLKKNTAVRSYGAGHFTLGQRFRDRGFKGGLIDSLKIYTRDITELEAMRDADPAIKLTSFSNQQLSDYYLSAVSTPLKEARTKLKALRLQKMQLEGKMLEISVMEELPTPRPTYILDRGEYDAEKTPDKLVKRSAFDTILKPFGEDLPSNRLGLAMWTTDPDHPLTSRVFVNRVWQNFFGTGIVKSSENFGLQGDLPSHPALLNWLARDFVAHDWDIKRLCKSIVLSATYRQDSVPTQKMLEQDPENKWLARGPAYRLSAEQIRDLALASSGLLNPKIGGSPVSPYQAGGDLWRESNNFTDSYRQSKGSDLYRRSLYSVWKRTAPLPNMMAFDTTSREVCTVARERTNTPMQALVLLNDVQFLEAARALATQILLEKKTDKQMIAKAFLKLTGREVKEAESQLLSTILSEQRAHYKADPEAAQKLVALGDSKPPANIDSQELAAFTIVCQTILNLDATIWKR